MRICVYMFVSFKVRPARKMSMQQPLGRGLLLYQSSGRSQRAGKGQGPVQTQWVILRTGKEAVAIFDGLGPSSSVSGHLDFIFS